MIAVENQLCVYYVVLLTEKGGFALLIFVYRT